MLSCMPELSVDAWDENKAGGRHRPIVRTAWKEHAALSSSATPPHRRNRARRRGLGQHARHSTSNRSTASTCWTSTAPPTAFPHSSALISHDAGTHFTLRRRRTHGLGNTI